MILITIEDIEKAFDDLINEKKSREEVSTWGEEMRKAHDNDMLKFVPLDNKDKIWGGIKFLSGVDMVVDLDGNYLYFREDFVYYKNKYT